MYDQSNIFAKMLRSEIPCTKKYEDDYALAFLDINPQAPVHILIIPKGAYLNFCDFIARAALDEVTGFYKAVNHVIEAEKLDEMGYRLISNTGLNGGQEVPHYHVHLLAGKKLGPIIS